MNKLILKAGILFLALPALLFSQTGRRVTSGISGADKIAGLSNRTSICGTADTNHVINWNFDKGMPPNVSEIGTVNIIINPDDGTVDSVLEVTVVDGGTDHIQQTIPNCSEYWLRMNFYITADTSGWDNTEDIYFYGLKNSVGNSGRIILGLRLESEALKYHVYFSDDDGTLRGGTSTAPYPATDARYDVELYIKKATAPGANDGIYIVTVDGVVEFTSTTWDNDATNYNEVYGGYSASDLNAIYYIDDVKLWSNEGLP